MIKSLKLILFYILISLASNIDAQTVLPTYQGAYVAIDTSCPDTVTDYDGNYYPVVRIGLQCWMAENLKVTHYSDGTVIPNVTTSIGWNALTTNDKAWCYYNNDPANGLEYGALYTYAAAMNGASSSNSNPSGIQGVCPIGWHLPSDDEWKQLEIELGMSQADADVFGAYRGTDEGGKLKETGTSHWNLPNTGAVDTYNFSAIGGGYRYRDGPFNYLNQFGYYRTSTEAPSLYSIRRLFSYDSQKISRNHINKEDGLSVRCVKD